MNLSALASVSTPRAAAPASRVAPPGPGWYESSWDLCQGLEVTECVSADLELRQWVDALVGATGAPQPRLARVASPRAMTAIA